MTKLTFRDYMSFDMPVLNLDALDKLKDSGDSGQVLRVQIRATNSGWLVNNRVYPGINMQNSVGTWTDKAHGGTGMYNRPVLLHHESGSGFGKASDPLDA